MAEGTASLDTLLADAGRGPVRRWFPGVAGAKLAARLATRPWKVARRSAGYGVELAKITVGQSDVAPSKKDRRFKDEAWSGNPAFRRLAQVYLAAGKSVDDLICDAGLDERSERRVRFSAENILDALAPTNFPALNPAALKATLDTGGRNLVQGSANLVHDLSRPPHIPAMVDTKAFTVGKDLAVTPGAVVLRTELFELIQYEASTPKVRETPLLLVPPMINKFYIADVAPGRSMLEYFVGAGQQCFTMSWRNPDERHAEWGLDDYVSAVLEALEAVETISGSSQSHVMGLCAGGITASCAIGHLAATDQLDRIAGLTLGVCVLDNGERRDGRRARWTARRPRRRSRSPSARATSTAARWRACSRGCAPTTWSGTTGSTTTCWARTRRPSTSSTGTPTRRTCRPGCTATSWSSRSPTTS